MGSLVEKPCSRGDSKAEEHGQKVGWEEQGSSGGGGERELDMRAASG